MRALVAGDPVVNCVCTALYFHGLPGSEAELSSFGSAIAANARRFHVVARSNALAGGDPSGYFRTLAGQIDLVSPTAPLNLGNFLGDMAGAPVFRAALAGRAPFAMLTWFQAQAARLAPARLAATLMASALGADRALAADPQFVAQLGVSLRYNLLAQRAAYRQEILLYAADW